MHFDTQTLIPTIVIVGLVCLALGMVLGANLTRPLHTREGRY